MQREACIGESYPKQLEHNGFFEVTSIGKLHMPKITAGMIPFPKKDAHLIYSKAPPWLPGIPFHATPPC